MIELKNVTHRYGEHTVLHDVSITLPARGIVAIMGPSGSGKTTLLRLLCGLEQPNRGSITGIEQRIAVSFQEPRLIPFLSCEKNITFVLPDGKGDASVAKELLREMELGDVADAYPDQLSGGMRARVSLARALATNARLLLLDEPFAGVDDALKHRLLPLVKRAGERALVILVTHDKDEALALGATVLCLVGTPVTALVPC